MSEEVVEYSKENGIATITLNRPAKANTLRMEVIQEMDAALADANRDDGIKVIILDDAGKKMRPAKDPEKTACGIPAPVMGWVSPAASPQKTTCPCTRGSRIPETGMGPPVRASLPRPIIF